MGLFSKISFLFIIFVNVVIAQNTYDYPSVFLIENKNNITYYPLLQKTIVSNQGEFDARYYKIDLTIDFSQLKISGIVDVRATALVDSLSQITLNLDHSMAVTNIGGEALTFTRSGKNLNIFLKRKFKSGENIDLTIEYEGQPINNGYFQFNLMPGENSPMAATLSEPYGAPYWWPCKDTPADKADSLDILVTVPTGYSVGSNGMLISTVDNGDGSSTFHWHEQYPIATYLVSIVAGSYHHFVDYYHYGANDSLLLDYYVYPNREEAADTVFSKVADYLDALSYYFGDYPFLDEKYGMAQFNWGGGMENQTLTSIGNVTPFWEYVYVHELGHHWFGDKVTCASWREIWLNEGFATYSEALYAEWNGYAGFPPGKEAYHAYVGTQKYFEGGTIIREDTLNIGSLFSRIVYEKASWLLHMLRHITGDEIFFDILKSYLNDHRWTYGSVRGENFIEICEQKSGLNLDKYFDQWLNYPYYPKYEFGWSVEQSKIGQFEIEVMIAQTQLTTIYEMPIDITFSFATAEDTTVTIFNNRAREIYNFILPNRPSKVVFDHDDWILKSLNELPYGKDGVMLEIESIYPIPFYQSLTIRVFNRSQLRYKIDIFNSIGRKIRTINDYKMENNFNYVSTWDGKNDLGNRVASGVYFLRPYTHSNGVDKFGNIKKVVYLK